MGNAPRKDLRRAPVSSPRGKLLIATITSPEPAVRDRSVFELIEGAGTEEILRACDDLEGFRQGAANLYERVRASMFLHALYRYAVQDAADVRDTGLIPFDGFKDLMGRRFEQAIAAFRYALRREGPNGTGVSPPTTCAGSSL